MAKSAYEKMFDNGSAFKPIKITQPSPNNPEGGMSGYDPDAPMDMDQFNEKPDRMDDIVEQAKAMKAAKTGKVVEIPTKTMRSSTISKNENRKIKELERRVSILEQALQLVMETQTKILKESK